MFHLEVSSKCNSVVQPRHRYIPNYSNLAVCELDEKHIAMFNFRNRESLVQLVSSKTTSEKVRIALSAQVCQKYMLISAVQLLNESYNEIRNEERINNAGMSPSDLQPSKSSADVANGASLFRMSTKLSKLFLTAFFKFHN